MCYTNNYCSKMSKVPTFILLLSFSWILVNAKMKIVSNEFEGDFNDSAIKDWAITNPF